MTAAVVTATGQTAPQSTAHAADAAATIAMTTAPTEIPRCRMNLSDAANEALSLACEQMPLPYDALAVSLLEEQLEEAQRSNEEARKEARSAHRLAVASFVVSVLSLCIAALSFALSVISLVLL